MSDARGSSNAARTLALVAGMLAGCGGSGGSAPDAALPTGADASGGSGPDAALPAGADAADGPANVCVADGGVAPLLCTCNPALASVTDLSGTWVLETIGAQTVAVPGYANPFHLKSINVILVQVAQNGNEVTLTGHNCDRIQHDDPSNPAKVVVLDPWRLTPSPVQRSGSFAPDDSGQWSLTLPTLTEVFGARLSDPATDALPTDPNDPRVVDVDNDGYPGLSVGLGGVGSLISGTLRSVQRQATALHGLAVAADRVEGGMAYQSDQSVVASQPPSLKDLFKLSTASTDPAACSSTFVMVKVSDVADAGAVDCAWVRANESALLGF
jgi:hypothetical protein